MVIIYYNNSYKSKLNPVNDSSAASKGRRLPNVAVVCVFTEVIVLRKISTKRLNNNYNNIIITQNTYLNKMNRVD